MPPEYVPTRRPAAAVNPTRSSSSSPRYAPAVAAEAVKRRLEVEQLTAGHERIDRRVLEGDADATADLGTLGGDVEAGDAGPPVRRVQQGDEHAHRGRLAGAVRPEEPEDLPRLHLQIDARHRLDIAKPAHEPLDKNRLLSHQPNLPAKWRCSVVF